MKTTKQTQVVKFEINVQCEFILSVYLHEGNNLSFFQKQNKLNQSV